MNRKHTGMHLYFLRLKNFICLWYSTCQHRFKDRFDDHLPEVWWWFAQKSRVCLPLSNKPAVHWGQGRRWGWPGSIYLLLRESQTTAKRCQDSPAAFASPKQTSHHFIAFIKHEVVSTAHFYTYVMVTCAISSVFLSFSSQETVISWINFSDSSSLSFSSGAFMDWGNRHTQII